MHATLTDAAIAQILRDERGYTDGPPRWQDALTAESAFQSRKKLTKRLRRPRSLQSANLQTPVVPPLIARALADEGYYRDGPPTWPGAPKSKDAKNTRKRYIKRLGRLSSQFPEAKRLANVLTRCKPRRRCMSGACPECGRAFQRWFVSEVAKLACNADAADLKSISIIFSKHRTAEDQLPTLDTTGMKRSMSETIKDVDGLTWMVGGVDLSLNDDTQKNRTSPGNRSSMPSLMPMLILCPRHCVTLLAQAK